MFRVLKRLISRNAPTLGYIASVVPTMLATTLVFAKELPVEVYCPVVTVKGEIEPALTETEKRLLCGEDGAWKTIPGPQARFNLKNFLQQRGYHYPEFLPAADNPKNGGFIAIIGERTRVTQLTAEGAPEALRLSRKRKVVGEILTPSLLGAVEQWVFQRMQAIGYPCPKISSRADPITGGVVIQVDRGPLQDLVSIINEPLPGGEAGVLRRYDAFRLGERFNGDWLTVTENRISQQRILQNAYFSVSCEEKGASARQEITAGPPRFLTFGFGFNTEGLLLGRSSWRNTRTGQRLSLVDLTLQASAKEQRITLFGNWFHFPWTSRRYWAPSVQVRHQNENAFEVLTVQGKWLASTTWDNQLLGFEGGMGPVFESFRTYRGSGRGDPNSFFTSLEFMARMKTHEFEYWQVNPRSGASLTTTLDFAHEKILSTTTAHRVRMDGQVLWNLKDYDPPLLILGLRGGLRLLASPDGVGESSRLPAAYFGYLGGSMDLRGFDRQAVPLQGAMTTGFLSPEIRLSTVLPFNIEPLVFWDLGAVGNRAWTFDTPLLHSPGGGFRWKSPVGTLRTTLAHGYPVAPAGGWNFYFSFGEEF